MIYTNFEIGPVANLRYVSRLVLSCLKTLYSQYGDGYREYGYPRQRWDASDLQSGGGVVGARIRNSITYASYKDVSRIKIHG